MIPVDSGSAGSVTDWSGYNIETLHAMVRSVTPDQVDASWKQVTAWQNTSDLLSDHAATLIAYRQNLVQHWSPEKNQAAATFVGYLDTLIDALNNGSVAAGANVAALSNLTGAVETAQRAVTQAYQEHAANQAKLDTYQQKTQHKPATGGRAVPMPMPGPPPVAPGRQAQLTSQAQKAMATLASAAIGSSSNMQVPPPYTPPTPGGSFDRSQHLDGPPVLTVQPPAIPPPQTSANRTATGPSVMQSGEQAPSVGAAGGPTLTGLLGPTGSTNLPTANPPTSPSDSSLPPGGLLGPGVSDLPGAPGFTTGPARPGSPVARSGPVGTLGGEPELSAPTTGIRGPVGSQPLPPGGLIGGPTNAQPVGGRPATGERIAFGEEPASQRTAPIGAVSTAGTTAPRGSGRPRPTAGRGATQVLSQQGRRRGRREDGDRQPQWDPDNPWSVDGGISPVYTPREGSAIHDAGPGVIGIDR